MEDCSEGGILVVKTDIRGQLVRWLKPVQLEFLQGLDVNLEILITPQ
jgi:hypothetical protein